LVAHFVEVLNMPILAQLNNGLTPGETLLGVAGIVFVLVAAIWSGIRWLKKTPLSPDPWDAEIAAEVASPDCTPLCHRCLEPHDLSRNLCPNCGAPVGQYINVMPYLYIFSIGHVFRIGTTERIKKSPLVVLGFLLVAVGQYSVFAPIYWVKFLLHLGDPEQESLPELPNPPEHS
jgi:hypothetical protein